MAQRRNGAASIAPAKKTTETSGATDGRPAMLGLHPTTLLKPISSPLASALFEMLGASGLRFHVDVEPAPNALWRFRFGKCATILEINAKGEVFWRRPRSDLREMIEPMIADARQQAFGFGCVRH